MLRAIERIDDVLDMTLGDHKKKTFCERRMK